jgi:outer membrane protein
MSKSTVLPLLAALTGAAIATPACAQDWFLRVGAAHVAPDSDNGRLAGGALAADVDSNTQLGLIIGRHFSPHFAVELLAATPFSHTAKLNGADAVDFKHLPPTLSAQWYFNPEGRVNPFIGAGLNYTFVYDEDSRGPLAGTHVSIKNSAGLALQAGLAFRINDRWDLVLDARQIDLDADVEVDGTGVGTVNVDPRVYGLTASWRF